MRVLGRWRRLGVAVAASLALVVQPMTAALASGLSAGLTSGLNVEVFGGAPTIASALGPGGAGLAGLFSGPAVADSLEETALDAPIQAGVSSLLLNQNFGQALIGDLRTDISQTIVTPLLMAEAGDIGADSPGGSAAANGSIEEALLHAWAGAIGGLIAGGPNGAIGGALGGALGELALGVDPGLSTGGNPILDPAGLSQILGGIGSLLAGDASMSGATAALDGYEYNYLSHTQLALLISAVKACNGDQGCIQNAASIAQQQSIANSQALQQCGANAACYQAAIDEMAQDADLYNQNIDLLVGTTFASSVGGSPTENLYSLIDGIGAAGAEGPDLSYAQVALDALNGKQDGSDLTVAAQNAWTKLQSDLQATPASEQATSPLIASDLSSYLAENATANFVASMLILNSLSPGVAGGAATEGGGVPEVAVAEGGNITNPIPGTLARVVPGDINATTLGAPGAADVFVTDAAALDGLTAQQIADTLSIPYSSTGYNIYQIPASSVSGIASPVNRANPGFIGGGTTAGGAPEYVIPNGPIPPGTTTTHVPP